MLRYDKSMKITSQEEYGLRCLVQVAIQTKNNDLASLEHIAEAEHITTDYAAKLLMLLRQGNFIESVRGKSGGYKLSRPSEKISLDEVIKSLSGELFESESCQQFTGNEKECVHVNCCSIRPVWISMSHILSNILKQITLKNLMDKEDVLTKYIKKEINLSI